MRSFLLLLIYLWTSISFAQTLNGVISLQNSQGKIVSGASIEASLVEQKLQTRSNEKGEFSFDLSDKVLGQQISLSVKKNGLEVVNPEALWLSAPEIENSSSPIVIQMAPLGTRKKRVEKYFELATQVLDSSANDSLLRTRLTTEEITHLKKIAYDHIEMVAQRLAEFDFDQASEMAQKAFSAFEKQQLPEALTIMNDAQMAAALKNSANGSVRGSQAIAGDTRKQSIENYLLKARLSVLSLKLKDAEAYYTRALYADQNDFAKIAEFTRLLVALKEDKKAEALCKKGFSVVRNDAQTLVILSLQANVLLRKEATKDATQTLVEAQKIYQSLNVDLPQAYTADIAKAFGNLGLLHYKNRDYESSIKAYNASKKIYSELILTLPLRYDEAIAQSFKNIGNSYILLNNYAQSSEALQQLVSWRQKSVSTGGKEAAIHYIQSKRLLANNHSYFGEFDKALSLYEDLAKDTSVDTPLERGQNYIGLAEAQFLAQKTKTALASSKQAENILKANHLKSTKNAQAYAKAMNAQAACHLRDYQFAKAIEIYNQLGPVLSNIQQKSSNPTHLIIAKSFEGMAKAYMGQLDFERAEKAILTALSIINELNESNQGFYQTEKIQVLNSYTALLILQNDKDKAGKILEDAIKLSSNTGETMPFDLRSSICTSYILQANLKLKEDKVEDAMMAISKGESLLGTGDAWASQKAKFATIRGEALITQGETEDSRTYVQEAINILTPLAVSEVKEYQVLLCDAYITHARAFIIAGQYTTAQARLEAAESLVNSFLTNKLPSSRFHELKLNKAWAEFYSAKEEYSKAEEKLFAAIDYLEQENNQHYRPLLAKTYYQLAILYHHTQAKKESLEAFQKAEKLSQNGSSYINQKVLANMYYNFAKSLKDWRQYQEALDIFQRSAEVYETMDKSDAPEDYKEILARIYTNMAWCSAVIGEIGHAEAYIEAALVQRADDGNAQLMQAHLWTINGSFSSAKKVYQKLSNKTIGNKKGRELSLETLNSFEDAGIKSPHFSKVRALYQ